MEVVFGVHPVTEAVRVRPADLDHVTVLSGTPNPRVAALIDLCRAAKIRVSSASREELQRMSRSENHGGAVAFLRERKPLTLEDLLRGSGDAKRFLLALDGVEDPHNLGALLRTADGAGVDGVLLPERRSAPITGTVAKASAGATEHVRVAKVTNIVRSLEDLKKQNIWIVGLDERGTDYDQFDFNADICLVLGREGAGLHDLTKRTCDFLLGIPMAGAVPSLNVSVAGAVVMYEAARQRRRSAAPAAVPTAKPSKPRKGLGS